MVKSELLQKLCNMHPNVLRKDMEMIINITLKEMTSSLRLGKNIEIRGFGTYKIVRKRARIGRNPKNSKLIQIPEKNAIKWKISKDFLNRLNKNFTEKKISDNHTKQ
jgi:integration host factor subunit beta